MNEIACEPSYWNSLEIAKLLVTIVSTLIVGLIAWFLERFVSRAYRTILLNQKVVEQRLDVYNQVVPLLNDLYCYHTFVGHWKTLTPQQILDIKRNLDKQIHIYKFLFSDKFFSRYSNFIDLCFETRTGFGEDAKLLTPMDKHLEGVADGEKQAWQDEYAHMFFDKLEKYPTKSKIREAYQELMDDFASKLGL